MPDDIIPTLPETAGKWPPHCLQTESGSCLADNLEQWAQLGWKEADEARSDIGGVDDSTFIIQAGRVAAKILSDAKDLDAQSREVVLCDHCPRRRL